MEMKRCKTDCKKFNRLRSLQIIFMLLLSIN